MSCTADVYQPSKEHSIEGIELQRLLYLRPSGNGLVKATAFTVIQDLGVLLVAVRGTANVIDHVVNMNGEVAAAEDFIVCLSLRLQSRCLLTMHVESRRSHIIRRGDRTNKLPRRFPERRASFARFGGI